MADARLSVKISAENVVFKVSEAALSQLLLGQALAEQPPSSALPLALKVAVKAQLSSPLSLQMSQEKDVHTLSLAVSSSAIQALAEMGKSRDGISVDIDGFKIILQVDTKTDSRKMKERP